MISVKGLTKTYVTGKVETPVLRGIDFHVEKGEFVSIMGKSGAGKSTFMYQMSLLDRPTSGEVLVEGLDVNKLSDGERTVFRLTELGYVFQDYALMPDLTAVENIMVPLLMMGTPAIEARKIAMKTLAQVELDHRPDNLPSQLSGGEQQRVSIARAVAQNPKILFADEPTANLDSVSSNAVLDVITELHKEGQTVVMVTHEKEYTRTSNRIVYLEDGRIVREEKVLSKK